MSRLNKKLEHFSLWSLYNGILSFVTNSGVKVTFSSSSFSSFIRRRTTRNACFPIEFCSLNSHCIFKLSNCIKYWHFMVRDEIKNYGSVMLNNLSTTKP